MVSRSHRATWFCGFYFTFFFRLFPVQSRSRPYPAMPFSFLRQRGLAPGRRETRVTTFSLVTQNRCPWPLGARRCRPSPGKLLYGPDTVDRSKSRRTCTVENRMNLYPCFDLEWFKSKEGNVERLAIGLVLDPPITR